MKVTRELLKRYGLGLCTAQERKEIEKWFDTLDDPSSRLGKSLRPTFDDELIWSKMSEKRPQLSKTLNFKRATNLVVFSDVMRYAAAACFVLVVFFAGRFSVGTAQASPPSKDPTADHLFIFGASGAVGNLPGENYTIEFDGALRLYNNSIKPKKIYVGDTTFMISSKSNHYLIGDTQNPELIVQERNANAFEKSEPIEVAGYFSIHRRYD